MEEKSHAKKVLEKVEAVIENRASKDDLSYTIKGRSLSRIPIQDLLLLRKEYLKEYEKEKRDKDIKEGKGAGMTVRFRHERPW